MPIKCSPLIPIIACYLAILACVAVLMLIAVGPPLVDATYANKAAALSLGCVIFICGGIACCFRPCYFRPRLPPLPATHGNQSRHSTLKSQPSRGSLRGKQTAIELKITPVPTTVPPPAEIKKEESPPAITRTLETNMNEGTSREPTLDRPLSTDKMSDDSSASGSLNSSRETPSIT